MESRDLTPKERRWRPVIFGGAFVVWIAALIIGGWSGLLVWLVGGLAVPLLVVWLANR
jgi:hypothetical protein